MSHLYIPFAVLWSYINILIVQNMQMNMSLSEILALNKPLTSTNVLHVYCVLLVWNNEVMEYNHSKYLQRHLRNHIIEVSRLLGC
jgi:hypothetical protein